MTLVKVLVTVGLFVLLFRPETFGLREDIFGNVSPATMLAELRAVHPQHIAAWMTFAIVVKFAGMFAGVLRWRLLLRGQGLDIPLWYLIRSWFIGRSIGIFLPGTIGHDGYRLLDSGRYTGELLKCTTVVVVEKLIGFIALTFLVFLTFPLGFRLLNINVAVLSVILVGLAGFVAVSFFLLLNPVVIQSLLRRLPVPGGLRGKVDKLGSAVTAYSGNRSLLITATFLGLLVHLGTCFMYFGTMMAVRAEGTTLWDILFASPIMIYGTVLGPSIGGEGIREIVFVTLLKGTTPGASAALFSHLGWWVGELVPFIVGVGFILFSPGARKELSQERAAAPARPGWLATALAGIAAGLVAGAAIGLVEGAWLAGTLGRPTELQALWWGPLVYGILFIGLGLGWALGLHVVYALARRNPAPARIFALALGLSLVLAVLVIGYYRVKRDVLDMHALGPMHFVLLIGVAVIAGLVAERAAAWLAGRRRWNLRTAGVAVAIAYFAFVVLGFASARIAVDPAPPVAYASSTTPTGPNIILVAVDTLRGDYLPIYNPDAPVETPHLEAFARDALLFRNGFAHAAWTKPSFASIFSGLYPGTHTATSKDRALPLEVTTFPEALQERGYHTQGFANNPNITAAAHFGQGFSEYVDLRPRLYLGAAPSSSGLSMYNVLRLVRLRLQALVSDRVNIGDFYQPGPAVNEVVLNWLDSEAFPQDRPFFLFVHYMDPHDPYVDAETGRGFARAQMEHPSPDLRDAMIDAYFDEIRLTDRSFGALLEGLKERGLYDDSVIVFTSDHGEEFYDHEGWWHGQTLYDEQIRVPYLLKLPGNAGGGLTVEEFARHIDIAPTLLHLAEIEPVAEMQGRVLVSHDGTLASAAPDFVYSQEDFEGNVLEAVRTHDTKLIRANEGNPRGLEPVEFYDLFQDPGEQTNLAGQGRAEEPALADIADRMEPVIAENAAEPALQEMTPQLEEQLGAIGYIGGD